MANIAGIPKLPKLTGPARPPTAKRPVMAVRPDAAPAARGRPATIISPRKINPVRPAPKPVLKPVPGGTVKRFTDPVRPGGNIMGGGTQHDDMIHPAPGVPGSVPGGVPVPGAATPAPPPNLMALLTDDERWKRQMIDVGTQRNQLMAQYGFGLDGSTQTEAQNPNSIVSQIGRGFRGNVANVQNDLNSRGILMSGANQAAVEGLEKQRAADIAQQNVAFQGGLAGINQGSADLWNTIYGDLLQRQGTLTPEPASPDAGAGGGAGTGSAPVTGAVGTAARVTANQKANAALAKTTGLTGLAQLYNASKGKVDDSVLLAIDAKLKAARAKGMK